MNQHQAGIAANPPGTGLGSGGRPATFARAPAALPTVPPTPAPAAAATALARYPDRVPFRKVCT
jgi:hypothetical protein